MRSLLGLLPLLCVTVLACSSENSSSSRFAAVKRWDCFEGESRCWCAGFSGSGRAGSSDPQVAACSTYSCCIATPNDSDWDCDCLDVESCDAEAETRGSGAMVVDSCPPH
jgi:hypothetical protein